MSADGTNADNTDQVLRAIPDTPRAIAEAISAGWNITARRALKLYEHARWCGDQRIADEALEEFRHAIARREEWQ
jgi:hypothetical protein